MSDMSDTTDVVGELVCSDTPRVDMRSIWSGNDQLYRTYDGRQCSYSIAMLDAVLGKEFAGAPMAERAAFLAYGISNRLDPIRKQVYFVRYKSSEPASFVTSWEVFLDRAQRHPQFDGYESGVVWRIDKGSDKPAQLKCGNPCDFMPDANHSVVGGWARVHRKDRGTPRYVEVPFDEMANRNRDGQLVRAWRSMPTTMAQKTPTARALRQSFPEDLAGLYTDDETNAFCEITDDRLRSGDTAPAATLDALADELDELDEQPNHSNGLTGYVGPDPQEKDND